METKLKYQIKLLIKFFISGLVLSGLTAFPIEWQLSIATNWLSHLNVNNNLSDWIRLAYHGIKETNQKYPFISYGTDWLAFAHLVIGILFIGPLRNPVKNIWIIEFGLIACLGIFPLAFIAGSIRGIPFYWQLIDCSFGLIGGMLLWICYNKIKALEKLTI
jgi:hypothetical protein